MAESKPGERGSWWEGWLQSAKEKSSTALQFMRNDLTELSQVVQEDVSSTATLLRDKLRLDDPESLANQAKSGLTTFISTIADAFSPTHEIEEDTELCVIHNSEPLPLDRWEAEVYKIQIDKATFAREPSSPPDQFEDWLQTFNLEDHKEEMAQILSTCQEVFNFYSQLVPDSVSDKEFWQRYYYRIHQLRQTELRRNELLRRADQTNPDTPLSWDDDEEVKQEQNPSDLTSKQKSDLVILGDKSSSSVSLDTSPQPSSSKENGSTEDDWEKDFDMELTEEDLAKVQNLEKELICSSDNEDDAKSKNKAE